MRILMISDVYFPRVNGVSTSTMTFRRAFVERGHEVVLIAPEYGQGADGDDIIRIPSRYLILDPEDRMMKMRSLLAMRETLRKRQFDILHIQTPFVAHYAGVRLARALALPRVESYHTFFEEYFYHYVPYLPKAWLRFAARRFSAGQCDNVDALIVPSMAMMDVLRRYGVRTRAEVIPTGMDLDRFRGGDGTRFRRRHGIAEDRPVMVHVGRVAFEKNIDFILQVTVAVRRALSDVLLIIAGEGPALKHLKAKVRSLGIQGNVLFVGYLSRDGDLLDCYRAGDVFVFASRTETQGLVLLEAMALGVAVVSTAVMGTKDILLARKGALVADEEVGDFSAKVLAVLQDHRLRERLQGEALAYVKEWSEDALAEKMLALYKDVVAAHGRGRRRLPHAVVEPEKAD